MRTRSARFARGLAIAYLVGLVVASLAMRYVGEKHFVTTLVIYLPRIGFFLPLPVVAGLLWVTGEKRMTAFTTVVGGLFWLFPIMGFAIGHGSSAPQTLRLMTWNTYFGRNDNEAIYQRFMEETPDVLVTQATAHRTKELFRSDPRGYVLASDDEFFIASKYPIVEKVVAQPFEDDPAHTPAFARYTLQTPSGLIDVFSVHPRSPREGVQKARGNGFRERLVDAGLLGESAAYVENNTSLRRHQVEALVAAVAQSKNPVLVAGDTNLPTSSWLFHHVFDGTNLHDAFDAVGSGFGYTFPAKRPWMRIDRILADRAFTFLRVHSGGAVASDHRYLVADLAR